MSTVLLDFTELLNGTQPIAQAVAGRIRPPWNRGRGDVVPDITFEKDDVDRTEAVSNAGPGNFARWFITLTLRDKTYPGVQSLTETVRTNLDYYSGTVGSTVFQLVQIVGESDDYDPETKIHSVDLNLDIPLTETAPAAVA